MNTSVRARHDARGFSFIELLVTIVIAGIAFAALVPVFVAAQQKGAGDNARNQALSLARDRIEKIRALDYDQIIENNLNSSTWYGGEVGNTVSVSNGGGSKSYTVVYSVVFVGGNGNGKHDVTTTDTAFYGNTEKYKQVTVSVSWTGNPKPVKTVVLSTSIYKQYQGSRINDLVVQGLGPLSGVIPAGYDTTSVRQFVQAVPVTFTAYVNDADASRTSKVTFLVYSTSGLVATLKQTATAPATTNAGLNGVYQVPWPGTGGSTGALDGTYTVKATAFNINGYAVNTVTATFSLETGSPPQITGAAAYGSDKTITLTWSNTTASDVVSYIVTRMAALTPAASSPGPPASYPTTPTYTIPFTPGMSPTCVDSDLTAKGYPNNDPYVYPGNSKYNVWYEIQAVDSVGRVSAPTAVSAIPHLPYDYLPPFPPTNLAGTVTSSSAPPLWVTLTWAASVDQPAPLADPTMPVTGIYGYRIYRSDFNPRTSVWSSSSLVATAVDTGTTWTDNTLKPLWSYKYSVSAIDRVYNESATIGPVQFTTPNYSYNHVKLQNTSTSSGYNITLTNTDGTAIDSWQAPTSGSWTTTPFSDSLPKKPDVRDHVFVYLPVGFTFKINYQSTKNGLQPWLSKVFTVTDTSLVTISGATYPEVDFP
jgi:prepilin-type N-terminal cleavage/methylation domain-containing protein